MIRTVAKSLSYGWRSESVGSFVWTGIDAPAFLSGYESGTERAQKGEKGLITLTLNTEKLTDLGLTQASVYLSRFTGDKVSDENEIPLSAILLPDFSGMTDTDKANAPVIRLSETDIDLSAQLAKKNKVKHDIQITNTGRSPLQISKLQVFNPALGVSLKKSVLQPGETTRLRVTIDKRNIAKKKRHLRILMITNDPMQPKVEMNIKAS